MVAAKHLTQNVHPRHSAKLPNMNGTNCFRKKLAAKPSLHSEFTNICRGSCFTEAVITYQSYSQLEI